MSTSGKWWAIPSLAALAAACASLPPAKPDGNHIINLYDAFGPPTEGLTHDFGFSALVRYEGLTILFDSGTNADILKSNAAALGIDLADVDLAVASHAHFDHINGFDYLLEVNPDVKIYFPADMFWGMNVEFDLSGAEEGAAASLPPEQRYFGGTKSKIMFRQSGRFWGADVEFVSGHTEIAPGLTLIATRSPFIGYFSSYPTIAGPQDSGDVKTTGLPELSLNLESPTGDVLMVGCSHSQVETIVRSTRAHLDRTIGLVFGGYHMLPYTSDEIGGVAARMKNELGVTGVAPAHCSGHAAFAVFREVFGDGYHMAGLGTTTAFP
ncbi:MAG: 7,8-dihydropterin-6-yl-methyl-4-(beta-D-ribofuranosyl)aminobenzene 5'-phosphate synthase [Chlamydiales bacterium]|jgi:7,8-dihydropterin-6-yl-methyl-4-(beta-D-ribofuranosyl)aminobenzene 5'-phosphate synthase